jgi:PTH1 family peptidyl-tRNA hydrolase
MLKADTAQTRLTSGGVGAPGAEGHRVILATTRTFMNLSGIPTRNLLGDLKIKADHLIVVHDELDIDLGNIRVKFGGGDNGHNGLKSIRAQLGTGDYFRVRVGIGRPTGRMDVTDWVLTNFQSSESDQVREMVTLGADAVESLINDGLDVTQGRFNS